MKKSARRIQTSAKSPVPSPRNAAALAVAMESLRGQLATLAPFLPPTAKLAEPDESHWTVAEDSANNVETSAYGYRTGLR